MSKPPNKDQLGGGSHYPASVQEVHPTTTGKVWQQVREVACHIAAAVGKRRADRKCVEAMKAQT